MFRISVVIVSLLLFASVAFCSDSRLKIPETPPPEATVADANALYIKIKNACSMSENASYEDYSRTLAEIIAEFDVFKKDQRDYPELIDALQTPVNILVEAGDHWSKSIKGYRDSMGNDVFKDYQIKNRYAMEGGFMNARNFLGKIDNMFYELKMQRVKTEEAGQTP